MLSKHKKHKPFIKDLFLIKNRHQTESKLRLGGDYLYYFVVFLTEAFFTTFLAGAFTAT
mgnify:CR=1 FL=1